MSLPEFREVDLRELLSQINSMFKHNEEYEYKSYDLTNGEAVLIHADATMINRVFTNLLKNSVQSLDKKENGEIELTLSEGTDYYLVKVADNGRGIPLEHRAKIFTPFFTTKKSGTGIGLMMSKKIIDLHKGKIWFESGKGKGTIFHVRLPKTTKNEDK